MSFSMLRALAKTLDPLEKSQIDLWIDFSANFSLDFPKINSSLAYLNNHLATRAFCLPSFGLADVLLFGALKACPIWIKSTPTTSHTALLRWYNHIASLNFVRLALADLEKAKQNQKDRSDKGSMAIPLPDAEMGQVVTRFPPEPSGYLHIGHAKAAMLNEYFAREYKGKLIIRFDDTNPSKEKLEYQDSIKEDLLLLGIKGDVITHTSDHFKELYQHAIRLIKLGKAYVDDTNQETMRAERFDGIDGKNRNMSIEDTLTRFEEMAQGTERGLLSCLRAKIDMQDKNKAMRDPVIYRCNLTPHHETGTTWKVYPTYDFACPAVDSIEGVTHALRTIEYRDRNAQYAWFLKALDLRWVHVWDFARLNFTYTLLSKRKLQWFVEQGLVTGWDDARFPTVRGIRRRGMTIEALKTYILSQGASQREILLEWDKIWTINKKIIDPISPRFTALVKENLVPCTVVGEAVQIHTAELPKHKKNATLGFKTTTFGPVVMLEQEDAASLEKGEEVTLMDWGNAIIKSITRQGDNVTAIDIELNLKGDFKLTKKKLTWLAPTPVVDVVLIDYDYLITKKKLEQDDEFADFVTPKTEFKTLAVGDANLKGCKKGDIIQLERKGYFIVDKADGIEIYVILIPDGKVASLASKAAPASEITQAPSNKKTKQAKEGSKMNMYPVESIYSSHQPSGIVGKMYGVESVYGPVVQASAATNVIAPNPATPAMQEAAPSAKHKKDKKPKAPVVVEVEVPLVAKLNIRVGKILSVSKHPDADTLYVEKIDVGEAEPRTVVSGLVKYMQPEDLLNKDVLCVLNLKPASMRGVISHAMVLCASTADKVEFLVPPAGSLPGDKVFFKDNLGEPELMLNPKKKIWEKVQVDFKTDSDRVARWKDVAFETSRGIVHSASLVGAAIK